MSIRKLIVCSASAALVLGASPFVLAQSAGQGGQQQMQGQQGQQRTPQQQQQGQGMQQRQQAQQRKHQPMTAQQKEKVQSKEREVKGKVLATKQVEVKRTGQKNTVVLLQPTKENEQRLVVDLGPSAALAKADIKKGLVLDVQGNMVTVKERPVLVASKVRAGKQTMDIKRNAQEQQARQAMGGQQKGKEQPEGKAKTGEDQKPMQQRQPQQQQQRQPQPQQQSPGQPGR